MGLGASEWFSGFSHVGEVSRVFGVCEGFCGFWRMGERFCGFWRMGERFCGFWHIWGFL